MVALPAGLPDAPGIRLTAAELLVLRDGASGKLRHRPLTRRAGAVPARTPGAGMDLREIRAYVAGDDPRRLDPAATARTGHPHIRSLHEDRDDTILLVADFRAPMLWGTGAALRSVRAARHLAQAGWTVALRGGSVACLVAGTRVAELRGAGGEGHMAAVCNALARQHDGALAAPGQGDLIQAIARAARPAHRGHALTGFDMLLEFIAIIAAVLGFGGIAGTAAGIAKILFVVFLVLFIISFVMGRRPRL